MIGIVNGIRFAEVHVPRTGGTSRKEALKAVGACLLGNHVDHVSFASLARWFPDLVEMGVVWTVRRNPAEIAVSLWSYLQSFDSSNPHAVPAGMEFRDWFLRVVLASPGDFSELRNHLEWWRIPGKAGMPEVLRYDRLGEDWLKVCERLRVDAPLPMENHTGAGAQWRDHFDGPTFGALLDRFDRDRHAMGWPDDWML